MGRMQGVLFIFILGCLCTVSCRRVGGLEDVPDFQHNKQIKSLAKYAVKEYNKEHNVALSFSKVVKAQQQVVGGMKYYLTLEAVDGAQARLYKAIIYVREWENYKKLQQFTPLNE